MIMQINILEYYNMKLKKWVQKKGIRKRNIKEIS
jgi:hypothetical protein